MKFPQVSVILCTYNRAALLERALASLAGQALPEDFNVEIIVVDNNSTDHTAELVRGFMSRHPGQFRYVFEKEQGKSFALNAGIREARGQILAFTDDDVTFDSRWLLELVWPFQQSECLGVGGKIVPVWPFEKPAWLQLEKPYRLMSAVVSFDLGNESCPMKTPPYGANMAFRREAFRKYGLFRTDLGPRAGTELRGEDTEFCRRLINAGELLVYSPRSIVYHPVEKRRVEKEFFLSWYYDYGRASARQNSSGSGAISLFGVPAYYLLRSLPLNALKWTLALSPARRFYYRLNTYLVTGEVVEFFSHWRNRPSRGNHQELKIVYYDSLGSGGVCHYTHQLAEALTRAGAKVVVLTTDQYELKEFPKEYEVYAPMGRRSWLKTRLQKMKSRFPGKAKPFRKRSDSPDAAPDIPVSTAEKASFSGRIWMWVIRAEIAIYFLFKRPDLVHFQWLNEPGAEYQFMRFLKMLGIPLVYTAHNLLPHEGHPEDVRRLYRKIYRLADRIVVHAEQNRQEMFEVFDLDPFKVSVIPHGSFDFFFRKEGISREAARQELGIPGDRKVILFFGLIRRYKGLEYLVQAFEHVKEHLDKAFLLIAGKIHRGDPEGFTYYSDLISSLSGRDDVNCVTRYVPIENVASYFIASDLIVLPYFKTYQSGIVLLAYAAGRPVVVTDTGGLAEIVEGGKSGFVVPPEAPRALAEAILTILRDPERALAMGEHAKRLAQSQFGWDGVALKTIEVYRSLCPSVPEGEWRMAGS